MEEADLLAILESTGLPVVYHHFVSPPKPPYVVYLFTASNNFSADNKVYAKSDGYQIELYTDKKDPASEGLIENALDSADIFYEKSETYIESEKLFQFLYEIEI